MKRALVTGGTGVTGNALVRYLLDHGVAVAALVRPGSFRKKYLPQEHTLLQIVECGMEDYRSIGEKLQDFSFDAFFHLSWDGSTWKEKAKSRNAFHLQNQNVSYALDAVELCRELNCPVFVMTGSQAQYGRREYPISETEEKHPENGYGMAKLCAEGMTRLLCREYGIRHIWAILFSVYGPYDATESLIDTTIRGLLRGEDRGFTAGIQEWDYLYSYDAAKALVLLAEKGHDGEVYHVAQGKSLPLKDYIETLYRVVAPDRVPGIGQIPYGENPVLYLGADIRKLKKETGFCPEYSFEEGIREIVKSIQKEQEIS